MRKRKKEKKRKRQVNRHSWISRVCTKAVKCPPLAPGPRRTPWWWEHICRGATCHWCLFSYRLGRNEGRRRRWGSSERAISEPQPPSLSACGFIISSLLLAAQSSSTAERRRKRDAKGTRHYSSLVFHLSFKMLCFFNGKIAYYSLNKIGKKIAAEF